MKSWSAALFVALAAVPIAATDSAAAGQPPAAPQTGDDSRRYHAADVPPPIARQEAGRLHATRPELGTGYVPYRYPGFDTCPCADGGCYHPGWYYCGGKPYRQAWWRRWIGAHLGHGSMLDAYPCHCVQPSFGRLYRSEAAELAPTESEE